MNMLIFVTVNHELGSGHQAPGKDPSSTQKGVNQIVTPGMQTPV